MSERGWIGVDFDGTLATYNGWEGPDVLGEPIPLMVMRVRGWLERGYEVRILTARVASAHPCEERELAREAIGRWCVTHLGRPIEVTSEKDGDMIELWDDRAVAVRDGIPLSNNSRIA